MNQDNNGKSSAKSKEFRLLGNDYFRDGRHFEALKCFNKALCYAKTEEEKAFVYGNRSVVYLELKLYRDCYINTFFALKGYPKNKIAKIIERKEFCYKIMFQCGLGTSPLQAVKDFIKLSYPKNPRIPYIANCLKMKTYDVFGRGIYTTRYLNPGDIIAIEKIRIHYLMQANYERCFVCLKTCHLNQCVTELNNFQMFCSFECAKKRVNILGEETTTNVFMINLECSEKAQNNAIEANKRGSLRTIFDYNWSKLSPKGYDDAFLACFLGLDCKLTREPDFESQFLAITHENKMVSYAYDVRNDGLISPIQGACYLVFGSLLNHACDPNVVSFEFDGSMVFYVAKPIKKGEQLFISYYKDSLLMSSHRECRRKILKEQFFFECYCDACIFNYNIYAKTDFSTPKNIKEMTVDEAMKEFKENNKALKNNFDNYCNPEAQYLIDRNVRLMHLLNTYVTLPFNN